MLESFFVQEKVLSRLRSGPVGPHLPDLAAQLAEQHYARRTGCILLRTAAMHLLQAGVDITVIALWLGHESIETTHIYLEANLALKERALQKVTPAQGAVKRFKADDALLGFLAKL